MNRFFTPLLRRVYAAFGVFLICFSVAQFAKHSEWNKERLYRRLLSGSPNLRVVAAADLVDLGAEDQLLRALKSERVLTRRLAEHSLWEVWVHAGGRRAYNRLQVALGAANEQRIERAFRALDQLIADYPQFAEAWNRRATLHWQVGHFSESIADCRKVVALNPHHFGAWTGMGLCQLHLGDVDAARASVERALKIHPHDPGAQNLLRRCRRLQGEPPPRPAGRVDQV